MLVVFVEQSTRETSVNAHELQQVTEIAKLYGCRVFSIPRNLDEIGTADDALAYVPRFDEAVPAVWIGYIPTIEYYQAIYDAGLKKNVRLVNTLEQHRTAMEFDRFYPLIADLTPKSVFIDGMSQLERIADELIFPVFVKGAVKSNKDQGWDAVIANDLTELRTLVQSTMQNAYRTRGKVIIRELVKLRTVATDVNGFPIGREYRAFVYEQDILDYGFYWDEYDDTYPLSSDDRESIRALAVDTARRVDVPFVSVDLAQVESGQWIVIEIGDGQFSGLSQISPLRLWQKLSQIQL